MTFFKFKNILPKNNKISSNRKKTTGFLANYWIWMGMIDSYKILKQKDRSSGKSKSDRKKLVNLQKQIIWHFLKNFFLFPLWFLSLLVPSYMRGRNNIWTNLRTIGRLINSREFYPLRIAVLSQFVFVFLIVQLGIIVFYKHALPVFGATYTFTQNIWTTASTTATGLHPDNKIGWNYYETASSTITAGNDIRLNTVTDSFTKTSDTDFGGATTSSVEVSGTGDSASIVLTSTVNEIYDWLQPQGGSPTSTVVTDPPVNLYSFRPFAYGGYIYYFNNQGSVYRYNTTQNSWDTLTSVSLGGGNSLMMPPTYDATNGILYFAVANEPGASSAFYSYNLGTSTWTSLHAALNSIHAGWRIYTIPEVVLGYVYIGYENSGLLSRYNIANDTWNNVTGTPLSSSAMNGSNGSNLLYFISTTHLYSYNVGTGESILLNSSVPSVAGIRSVILDKNKENIFLYSYYNFYKYNIANNTWTTLTKFSDSNNFNPPYFYSSQEDNNQIYGTQGFDYTNFYTFNVTDGQWTALADIPNTLVFYLVQDPDNHAIYGASSALPVYKYVSATLTYDTSGTYTSAVIDNGSHAGYTTAEYTTTLNSQTITVDVRSGNTATPDGTWTDWLTGVANGGDISSLDNARYIQYRVNMSTNDITKTPTFNDITVNFNKYTSGELISSKYNTSDSANILANIMWDATTTIDNNIKFQLQTSNNGTDWSGWLGPDGSSNTYFSNTGDITTESLIDSSNDQWFQYKVLLTSNGISTPILSSVTLTYVVNANPVVSNVIATESTDGSVIISYDVLDRDTSNGETPGTILPTFEYLDGNGDWITATTFSENATSSKAVEEFTTSTHSLIWYPKTDFDGQYLNNCQIRVKVNDSEAANNLGTAMSEPFVLDTTSPVISGFLFDGRNDNPNNITITASDDTLDNLLIKISNLNNLNPDGTNASSGIWLAYTPNFTWRMDNSSPNIYYQLKDYYGNTTSVTPAQLPGVPNHAVYRDISNAETTEWREFVAWATVANHAYGFKQYNVYRSDDGGTSFTVIDTIANRSINYYIDSDPTLNPETTYSYKITAQDNNNNESDYSNLVTDAPNGQGGSDFTAPTISNVNISYITPNGATITWDTDEPADSNVDYILSTGGNFDNAPSVGLTTMTDNVNSLGQHTIVLTGLNPSTQYYFQVRSTDPSANEGTKILDIDGYSFETIAGPTISNIIVSNISNSKATITWETDEASDSYVYVADNSNFSAPVTYGNTNATNNHSVTVDNLVLNTRYYFYVASGVSYDKNVINGEITYYDFNTTADTSLPIITFSNENGISNLGDTSARISWTTDKSTTSTLDYGLNTNYGNTLSNDNYNTNHSYDLSSLTLGTTYYVRIQNTDLNNNSSTSTLFTFTTTDTSDVIAPNISNVTTRVVLDNEAIIVWDTNEGSSSQVFYGTNSSTLNLASSLNITSNLTHTVVLSDLSVSTLYYYQVESADANGNTTTSTIKEFTTMEQLSTESDVVIREAVANQAGINANTPSTGGSSYTDSTAPTISKVNTKVNGNSVIISWETNEDSDGMIYLGNKEDTYTKGVSEISRKLNKTHEITILNIIPLTTYYYQITSADASHNVSKASTGTFTTLSPTDDYINNAVSSTIDVNNLEGADAENLFITSLKNAAYLIKNMSSKVGLGALDSALSVQNSLLTELSKLLPTPVVSGQPLVNVTSNSATIAWNTDKESNSLVSFSDENTYRASALYDQTIGETDKFVLNHLVEIKNLAPDTFYHYSVISRTNTGAETRSQDFNFKTSLESNEIQNYSIDILSPAEAIFSWKTNLPTESTVSFTPYRNGVLDVEARQIVTDKSLTLNHEVKLNNLEAGVIYDIELSGTDINDNILSKAIKAFSSEKENLPPIISQIQTDSAIIPGEKERIQVIISWLTNELSTSRVLYQKGFNKDGNTTLESSSEIDTSYTKKHVVVINDFDPGAVYQFQVESIDSSGNSTISKTINILTPQKEESVFQVIFGSFQNMFSWVGKIRS